MTRKETENKTVHKKNILSVNCNVLIINKISQKRDYRNICNTYTQTLATILKSEIQGLPLTKGYSHISIAHVPPDVKTGCQQNAYAMACDDYINDFFSYIVLCYGRFFRLINRHNICT